MLTEVESGVYYDTEKYQAEPDVDFCVLGDGQLGNLFTQRAHKMGLTVSVVGSDVTNSGGQLADVYYRGDIENGRDFARAMGRARHVVLDTEHVDSAYLSTHPDRDKLLFAANHLPLTQNKALQHLHLEKHGIPLPPFRTVNSLADLLKALKSLGGRGVLQTGNRAYDGRGNAVVESISDIEAAWKKLGDKGHLFVEKFVPFEECAIQVVRPMKGGQPSVLPLVHSIHREGMLYLAESSLGSNASEDERVKSLARRVSDAIPGVGLLTVECFRVPPWEVGLFNGERLLVNEVAIGRPHNSGHHTLDSLEYSQFDHIIHLGKSPGLMTTRFRDGVTNSAMLNLIGAREGGREIEGIDEVEAEVGVKVYDYGKKLRDGRKVGHVNAAGSDPQQVRDQVFNALDKLNEINSKAFRFYEV